MSRPASPAACPPPESRPAAPLLPAARGPSPWTSRVMVVAAARWEVPGVRTLELALRDAGPMDSFLAGQFNMLCLPGIGECAISIAGDPTDRTPEAGRGGAGPPVRHTFRAVGNVTHALARLVPGDEVVVRGPFGTPWPLEALRGRDLVIVGGGLGLASLRAAILHVLRRRSEYGRIAILHGARTPGDLLDRDEHDAWRAADATVLTIVDTTKGTAPGEGASAVDAPWAGPVGFVPALFDALDIAPRATSVLCCGPEPMMKAVASRAFEAGVAPHDVWLSMERNMACATGFCGLCQFGPTFVCRDGPVFRHDRIAPFLAVDGI